MDGHRVSDGSQCSQAAINHQAQHKYVNNQSLILIFLSFSPRHCLSLIHTRTLLPSQSLILFFLFYSSLLFFSTGGTKFSVSKEKLLQHKGSLFEQMIVSNHPQQLSSGEYVLISPCALLFTPATCFPLPFSHAQHRMFFERDPKCCHKVIRFLLYGDLQLPSNELKRRAIEQEFEFFNIPLPAAPTTAPAPVAAPLPAPAPALAPRLFLPRGSLYVPFLASHSLSL